MIRRLISLIVVLSLSLVAGAAEIVARSPLAYDAAYLKLPPLEQLKKLNEAASASPAPADLPMLRREAMLRYVYAESKGIAGNELKAYQALAELAQKELPKLSFSLGQEFDAMLYSYFAAIMAEPDWQSGDAAKRVALVTRYEKDRLSVQNVTTTLLQWIVAEHMAAKVAGVPLKDRGMAKLKAMAELNLPNETWAAPLWEGALAEHIAMTGPKKIDELIQLSADLKMSHWAGISHQYTAARTDLLADPAWAGADAAGRKAVIAAYLKAHPMNSFASSRLSALAEDREQYTGNGKDKIADLAAAVGDTTDPVAALTKLQGLLKSNLIPSEPYRSTQFILATRIVLAGDVSKPLAPTAELAKWKPMGDSSAKSPLQALNRGDLFDLPAIAAALAADPGYAKGTPVQRLKIAEKVQATYYKFGSPFELSVRAIFVPMAEVAETEKTQVDKRPAARLAFLSKLPSPDNNQHTDFPLSRGVNGALIALQAVAPAADGKAKLARLQALEKQKQITFLTADDEFAQAVVDMLDQDSSFKSATDDAKLKRIDQMQQSKQIDFFTANDVKRYFKVAK
jgi:hypothetical protein